MVGAGDESTESAADVEAEDASDSVAVPARGTLADAAVAVRAGVAVKGAYNGAGLSYGVLTGGRIGTEGRCRVWHPGVVAQRPDACAPLHAQRRVDHDPASLVERQPQCLDEGMRIDPGCPHDGLGLDAATIR